jgi:hypothetical protein
LTYWPNQLLSLNHLPPCTPSLNSLTSRQISGLLSHSSSITLANCQL